MATMSGTTHPELASRMVQQEGKVLYSCMIRQYPATRMAAMTAAAHINAFIKVQ
jgi:hypothetical protein